jgi:hypothetical protein
VEDDGRTKSHSTTQRQRYRRTRIPRDALSGESCAHSLFDYAGLGLAEDIVQDSFIQAFRTMRGFDAMRPFEPWFIRSVVNSAVKTMQRSARQIEAWDDADESLFAELAARGESVETQVESIEVQNQIWDAMQKFIAEAESRHRAKIFSRNERSGDGKGIWHGGWHGEVDAERGA